MTLADEIKAKASGIFAERWTTRKGTVVPAPADLKHSNDAVEFERATVLYADLDGSTAMVDKETLTRSAEIYKAYLYAASRLIRNNSGDIVSYDGDRVMGVFIGDSQTSNAGYCALQINYAVKFILQPQMEKQYGTGVTIRHVVGIDTSTIRAARTGVRGDNDIVWVGPAANYAAKLTTLPADYPTWITGRAYDKLRDDRKYGGNPRRAMWEERAWTAMNNMRIFRSNWWWSVD